ncbi:Peptidase M28 family protein [Candida albicans]|uniref:Peptide hydrolase n=1 Tax=Candida albicans TaxID=5476 RepID=A0A8H6BVI8_CANAX|nr:Peptidase M28 family protein [Candida albicans]
MRITVILGFTVCLTNAFPLDFPEWTTNAVSFFTNDGYRNSDRLIKLGPENYRIVSENEKLKLKRNKINFIDVTNQIPIESAIEQVYNYPKHPQYEKKVLSIFQSINVEFMQEKLSKFTSFYTRYYKSDYGAESAEWLYQQISDIIAPVKDTVTISKVEHKGWKQFSIIVSIPGKVTDKVVVGAHQDSANLILPNLMKAPGADDDGSGTVTILESLRLLIASYKDGTFKPYNTLEFHWYSAEEGGLLGSIDVFTRYSESNQVVVGMLQQDMTGYTQGSIDQGIEPHFGLIADYTSVELNNFLKQIITNYNSIPYHESECGYACSDHASALENGYPSSFLIESEMKYSNKYIHSTMDTIDRLDWAHIKEHVKLTVAYAYELSLARNLY